jgi:hypothetical protein
MKTILHWLNHRPLLWTLLGFATTAFLVSLGFKYDLSKSDWGTWVGAIGTAAALFGTIYIARTETRRRERAERELALITAASFSVRIPEMGQALMELERQLSSNIEAGRGIDCGRCVAILSRVDTWSQSDLASLLPLGSGIAVRLGLAQAEVASIMGRLKEGDGGHPIIVNPQQSYALNRTLIRRIDVVLHHLKGTRNECLTYLLKAGIDDAFAVSLRASIERTDSQR